MVYEDTRTEYTRTKRKFRFFLVVILSVLLYFTLLRTIGQPLKLPAAVIAQRTHILEQCKYINTPAGPPPNFRSRTHSDRYVPGTKPLWLKNAKLWTGARNGTEVIYGDILLDKGLIQAVGYIPPRLLSHPDLRVEDAKGAWVTPGLVDLHSHIGVGSSPSLRGAADTNSRKAPILPWLRSIDALNTHDASYELAIAGGVTTAQILPGSANNIGGQSFVIKLRPTSERSSISKVIEPPYTLNGSHFDHSLTPRWRHMKHACGENPSRVYSQTRMDSAWEFRQAYNEGRKLKESQDQFCAKAKAGLWDDLGEFPEDLQWESLVDVLRGKVKALHCYEAVDLDVIVRLSNEFKFPVASFHHAGETYLVPDLLKKTWGGVPSIALFATNARKKREAYRNSEFAMRVLADHGIPVVMKSDHPVVNSRYLLNEAALAHFYGLNPALALASVTSTPADALGLGHRVGTIREGYDADIVIWDSHPLALGATPKQVYIDGIPQIEDPQVSPKPESFQVLPKTPNFDHEAATAVKYDGLPPLTSRKSRHVMFTNVSSIYTKNNSHIEVVDFEGEESKWLTVAVRDGIITCVDKGDSCRYFLDDDVDVIDLRGGSLAPGLTTFGSPIGLVEIRLEPSTNDGKVYDPLHKDPPSLVGGGEQAIIRAVDGLQFGGRNTLLAYRGGVTTAVTAPSGEFLLGLSTAFAVGASNALEKNAIIQDEASLHIAVSMQFTASVSTQIAALRRILYDAHVVSGDIPLVIHVENVDIMASLLHLKAEYDRKTSRTLRLTFAGAAEAHLLAQEISDAGVSVILTPSRPFPYTWDQRRILPGPPLSYDSAVTTLLAKDVNVAIGVVDEYTARNTRFDLAWAALESDGKISKAQAIALATTNVEKALGLPSGPWHDIVAYSGGNIFDFKSTVVGVVSAQRRVVDIFN
ncbi:hypothetical protein PILCRDRAFT_73396 [Piloderma croceum F 1598]|uniref:Amidohydrolase-related domain-containing protein n=1 Tax=Piloderma croceum (strain F 1598) TaxID=765440 RepID=A0A0C3B1V5_PILCF|nr:hypothetical protein PILCRDRAFT_73396 [Piloderma croceum F 1598]